MEPLISLHEIKKHFPYGGGFRRRRRWLRAVDGVSFDIKRKEILGLVGESGCGKTTLARVIIGLNTATSGTMMFEGNRLDLLSRRERSLAYRKMNIVFQDPYSSLDPRWNIYNIIREPLGHGSKANREDLEQKIITLLNNVGLSDEAIFRYPHEFSGGQRQRIAIARALVTNPSFIILDEPTSSLDVSVQAQILNLLIDLQKLYQTSYILISHNLGVIRFISDRIVVMYLGKVVETARKNDLFTRAFHPYTRTLLAAVPQIGTEGPAGSREAESSIDETSPLIAEKAGCIFFDRCPERMKVCDQREPEIYPVGEEHSARCFLYEKT